jgi:circadian clock protein KaiB
MKAPGNYKFLLYTAEDTQNSALAVANLTAICKAHLGNRYAIEVIDVVRHPQRALEDGIRMTPTLVKLWPHPKLTIVGTLSQTQRVMTALGIVDAAAA